MEPVKSTAKPLLPWVLSLALGAVFIFLTQSLLNNNDRQESNNKVDECALKADKTSVERYGFNTEYFHLLEGEIKPNQVLGNILTSNGLSHKTVHKLVEASKEIFNIRQIRPGKKFAFVHSDLCQKPDFFIYEPDQYSFVLFKTTPPYEVEIIERPVDTEIESAEGVIETSLWNAMGDGGMPIELIAKMEDALAWSVDFYAIQKGDRFKLTYERKYIEGEPAGVGKLIGATFESGDNKFYAIHFENERYSGYYDLQGRATKRAFLKSPVKYSRVSSGFNPRRFHPVLKRYKAHLGTDYAAPSGTPINAVADGTIIKAAYTRNNGNYVKIRHSKSYQTQYLHMKGFAKGIKSGKKVKQGDVIGYVGQTGLATGPHVCFRFWKNGRQVDHRRLNFPPPAPLPAEELPAYFSHRNEILKLLGEDIPADEPIVLDIAPENRDGQSGVKSAVSNPLP